MGLGEHIGDPRVKSRSMKEKKGDKPVRDDCVRTGRRVLLHIEKVMGPIGLDPCGNPGGIFAQTTILLPSYLEPAPDQSGVVVPPRELRVVPGFEDRRAGVVYADGLKSVWAGHGLTFVNNPWSDCAPWIAKAAEDGDEVLMLTQARMNAIWMHEHGFGGALEAVGFTRGRIPYETDVKMPQPPFHSVLLYFGARRELFRTCIETMPGGKRTPGGGACLFVR